MDISIENLLSILLSRHPTLHFEVALQGTLKRGYEPEVVKISENPLVLNVNREGILDLLPKSLYTQPLQSDNPVKAAALAEQNRQNARKFWRPFEGALYDARIAASSIEEKCQNHPDFFNAFWAFKTKFPDFSEEQCLQMTHFLTRIDTIIGDWEQTAKIFEKILKHSVRIQPIAPLKQIGDGRKQPHFALGKAILGQTACLTGVFFDVVPALLVEIEMKPSELPDFLPEGKQYRVLNILYSFFLPAEAERITKTIII
jgi:hypothetical protein